MLKPIVSLFEKKVKHKIVSILIAYVIAVIPLITLILFFINQTRILFTGLPSSRDGFNVYLSKIFNWVGLKLQLDPDNLRNWISIHFLDELNISMEVTQGIFLSASSVIANIVLISLITYFLLLYRTAFKNFLLVQVNPKERPNLERLLSSIQKLTKRYMLGQGLVILILGFLIGSGLWIIGVPYPYFWGYLAGFLEIIPYVGTTIGGLLPFSYMLLSTESIWQPLAVIVLYIFVQQIEGNIISPNVMGPSIKINPMFIIMGLFLGGFMWGIAGMILALPILALLKEIFRSFDSLVPFSFLMEDGLSKRANIFLDRFDHPKNRFFNLFVKEK